VWCAGPWEDLKADDEKPQSLISHLVSSLSSGQDLTRVLIPTFFLEPRSLLEKYTDLWAHPQLILPYDTQTRRSTSLRLSLPLT
jgi:hypothetical protein